MAKILLIEDDEYVRRMYQRLFTFQKYDVDVAINGAEGLEKAISGKPSLILLDILLPGMSGLDVLTKLKEEAATRDICVLVLTNLGDEKTVNEAMKRGAEGVMIKAEVTPAQVLAEAEKHMKP